MEVLLICGLSFLFLVMLVNIPVAFAVGMAAVLYTYVTDLTPLEGIIHRMALATESWPIMAVPFFVLMGNALNRGKSGKALMDLANSVVGSVWGGLASVSIVISMFFGGCSGSAVADASSVGSVLIPEMVRKGYGKGYSAAVNACSSTIGIIIPPSIPMILYGWVTELSIRKLFLAGLIPGVLVGLFQIVVAAVLGYRRGYYRTARPNRREIVSQLGRSWPAMLTPVIVMGGILGGVYTTTEGAIIGALYVIAIEMIFYKGFTLTQLYRILVDSAKVTGVVVFLIATSFMLTYVIVLERIPSVVEAEVIPYIPNAMAALLVITLILLITGCFLDLAPSLLIFTPVLHPVALKFGIDPAQMAVVVVMVLAIGLFTPPVGQTLYISALIADARIEDVSRDIMWFLAAILAVIVMVIVFPPLTTWLSS